MYYKKIINGIGFFSLNTNFTEANTYLQKYNTLKVMSINKYYEYIDKSINKGKSKIIPIIYVKIPNRLFNLFIILCQTLLSPNNFFHSTTMNTLEPINLSTALKMLLRIYQCLKCQYITWINKCQYTTQFSGKFCIVNKIHLNCEKKQHINNIFL